ncbi:MAG TPA: hypothetical protein VGP07_27050 [Polyangia bacterium]
MSEGGCTNCGNKGGCDSRKHGMFAAVDEALALLYPTRRWGERDDAVALEHGITREEGEALSFALAKRMGTAVVFKPGEPEEWCDYIYVLCLGRTPCIAELRDSLASDGGVALPDGAEDGDEVGLDERYLRVVLSGIARLAGVQEVAMTLRRQGEDLVITESARSGVFDPILLPRFQSLVAGLAVADIRHVDFGEIVEAPEGFDPGGHAARFGAEPVIANYLFYPQSPTAVSTVVLRPGADTLTSSAS